MAVYGIGQRRRGSGVMMPGIAGEPVLRGAAVYMSAVDGLWYLADSDAVATMYAVGITAERAAVAGQIVQIVLVGLVGRGDWAWNRGDTLYVSGVPGVLTQVAPALAQPVAVAITSNLIYVNPALAAVGGAAAGGGRTDFTYLVERDDGTYTVYDNQGAVAHGPGADADVEINWALTNGGAGCLIVLEPDTTFAIDDPITFTANGQVLQGAGFGSFIDGDGLATTEHGIVLSGFDDCVIRNLSIQTQDGAGKTCHCIFIDDGADRFLIENVTFVDSDHTGIWIEGTSIEGGHIHNCRLLDADNNGIYVNMDDQNYLYNLEITSCEVTSAGERGIMFDNGNSEHSYFVIQDNIIHDNGYEGLLAYDLEYSTIGGNIIFSNGYSGLYLNSGGRTTVTNNTIMSSGRHGIYLVNEGYVTLDGNIILYSDYGATFSFDGINIAAGCDHITASNNQLEDNRNYGIYTGAPNTIIEGNGVTLSQEHGIVIDSAECICANNSIYDNSQHQAGTAHGIYLTVDASRATIEGNICNSPGDSQEDGIYLVSGCHEVLIEGNYCYNCMGSGISLEDDNDNCHIEDNYCSANDDYGIEITTVNANSNFCRHNHLLGNDTGCILDNGTDTATLFIYIEPPNPNSYLGDHPAMQMLDGVDTLIRFGCYVPLEFQELLTAQIVVAHTTAVTWVQDMVWTVTTDFGKICIGESYTTHSGNAGATTSLDINELECLDTLAALPGLGSGDRIGFAFTRDGDNVADDIAGTVYFLGFRLRYV